MRKVLFTLLILFVLPIHVSANEYEPYKGFKFIKKVDEAYLKSQPRKMEKNWKKFCEVNRVGCVRGHDAYYAKLFEAKQKREVIKKEQMQNIARGFAAGYYGASGANNSNRAFEQNVNWAMKTMELTQPSHIYSAPTTNNNKTYRVYDSWGLPVSTIKETNW